MCGICGWLNTQNSIDYLILKKMNNIVGYRGPDDEGYTIFSRDGIHNYKGTFSCNVDFPLLPDERGKSSFLAFGHRRLSILDLSKAGHQPMQSDGGNICITFNGEIYNYLELQKELEFRGYEFNSSSDTEVLLHSYEEWGEECVHHFNGVWAFAIWDSQEKKLFCSRDRLGVKPFYYFMDDENFIFSSEIKQLCQNPVVPRIIDEEYLMMQIIWGLSDFSQDTLIQSIKSLRGGYNLIVNVIDADDSCKIKAITLKKYWDLDTKCRRDMTIERELFETHRNAVAIRTRSDVPIGILLSGGLDSSALVAGVSEYYAEHGLDPFQINTFTSCYKDFEEGDERKFAQATNAFCHTRENLIYPNEKDTFSLYKDLIWHVEGLIGINSLGSFMTLRDISKTGIKVMLNGQGADEIMFGYERYYSLYLKDILYNNGLSAFIKEFNSISENSKLNKFQLAQYYVYFNSYFLRKIRNILRVSGVVTPYTKNAARRIDARRYTEFKTWADLQYNEIRNTQLTHILRGDDRMYMAFSMESRCPFIDYRFIEKAVQFPEKQKITNGYTKYPLRKYLQGRLPNEVIWRKNKMGWPSPRQRWIERFDKTEVNKLFVDARSSKWFDIRAVQRLYFRNPYAYEVEQFINVELFMRLFDVVSE